MRSVLFILFITVSFASFSADVKTVIEKMQSVYASKDMSYSATYRLYKGHSSTKVHSSYNGKIISKGENLYQKIKNTEFIYTSDFFLKISQEEKILAVDLPQKNNQLQVDVSAALKQCASKTIKEVNGDYIIELTLNNSAQLQCSKIVLKIASDNYVLKQLEIYYTYFEDFSTSYSTKDLHQPKLSIEFSSIVFNPTVDKKIFDLSKYVSNRNGSLSPTAAYTGYELIDYRLKR